MEVMGRGAPQVGPGKEERVTENPTKVCSVLCQGGDSTPPFCRLRQQLQFWEKLGASKEVILLISQGVHPDWPCPTLPCVPQERDLHQQKLAKTVLENFLAVGAAKKVPLAEAKYLVPWFVIQKVESSGREKLRLISDCRVLNRWLTPKRFRLDHWKDIFPVLRKDMWAAKIDLKNAYFHLELSSKLKPYVCMKVGEEIYQIVGACFGLSTLP
jgi:hypothetical protein